MDVKRIYEKETIRREIIVKRGPSLPPPQHRTEVLLPTRHSKEYHRVYPHELEQVKSDISRLRDKVDRLELDVRRRSRAPEVKISETFAHREPRSSLNRLPDVREHQVKYEHRGIDLWKDDGMSIKSDATTDTFSQIADVVRGVDKIHQDRNTILQAKEKVRESQARKQSTMSNAPVALQSKAAEDKPTARSPPTPTPVINIDTQKIEDQLGLLLEGQKNLEHTVKIQNAAIGKLQAEKPLVDPHGLQEALAEIHEQLNKVQAEQRELLEGISLGRRSPSRASRTSDMDKAHEIIHERELHETVLHEHEPVRRDSVVHEAIIHEFKEPLPILREEYTGKSDKSDSDDEELEVLPLQKELQRTDILTKLDMEEVAREKEYEITADGEYRRKMPPPPPQSFNKRATTQRSQEESVLMPASQRMASNLARQSVHDATHEASSRLI